MSKSYYVKVEVFQHIDADSAAEAIKVAINAVEKSGGLYWPSVNHDSIEAGLDDE